MLQWRYSESSADAGYFTGIRYVLIGLSLAECQYRSTVRRRSIRQRSLQSVPLVLSNPCNLDGDDGEDGADEKLLIAGIALTDHSITVDRSFPTICFLSGWLAGKASVTACRVAFRQPADSDGQKLTKKLPTESLTNFLSQTNSLTNFFCQLNRPSLT